MINKSTATVVVLGIPVQVRVRIVSHASHEAEFFDDVPTVTAGTTISASNNTTVPNIDVQLMSGPVISGTIVDGDGTPLSGITVEVFNSNGTIVASTLSKNNGHYEIALAAGTYRLGFNTVATEGVKNLNYVGEYYENTPSLDQATQIVLTKGNALTINDELTTISNISGRVTTISGEASAAEISLLKGTLVNGKWQWSCCSYKETTTTLLDGYYRIENIEPGDYLVYFAPDMFLPLDSEYYLDQRTQESAIVFSVTATSIFTDVNAVLEEAEAPVSALTLNAPGTALVDRAIALSATSEGSNVSYAWNFGDGGVGTGRAVSHIYTTVGTYTITLTASNTQGEVVATSEIIVTNHNLRLPHLER